MKFFCILLSVTFLFEIGMLLEIGYCTPKPLVSLPVLTKPGPCSERPSVGLAVPLPRYLIQILVVHSYNSTISTQDIVSNLRATNLGGPSVSLLFNPSLHMYLSVIAVLDPFFCRCQVLSTIQVIRVIEATCTTSKTVIINTYIPYITYISLSLSVYIYTHTHKFNSTIYLYYILTSPWVNFAATPLCFPWRPQPGRAGRGEYWPWGH